MRHAMSVTVFFGMLGVTFFGLLMMPVFYVTLRALSGNRPLSSRNRFAADLPGRDSSACKQGWRDGRRITSGAKQRLLA
jgi:multidrug efflux pump